MTATRSKTPSYIIKRPRLTKLLDESEARIILLCAPAGYGKTTLAREWAESQDAPVAWYTGATEMVDSAAVAIGLGQALEESGLLPDGRERMAALAKGDLGSHALAHALASGLSGSSGLLVIDDYHHALDSEESERLIALLVTNCDLRILVTTRARPSWFRPRMEVYGDALSLGGDDLMFTDAEARSVLTARSTHEAEVILASARGWPAVIGLAARDMSSGVGDPGPQMPTEFFNYLAEDVFDDAPEALKRTLFLLALCGSGRIDVLAELVGDDLNAHLGDACERGLVERRSGAQVEIHPLIQTFLTEKLRQSKPGALNELMESAIRGLASAHRWDDCLRALTSFPVPKLVDEVFAAALPDLLESGRIATVARWLDISRECESSSAAVLVAEADIAFRRRDEAHALGVAEHAAQLLREGDLAAHAHLVAARAAHLRGDDVRARRHAVRAQDTAQAEKVRVAAQWLEFLQSVEANDEARARALLDDLSRVADQSATHALRLRNASAFLAFEIEGRVFEAAAELGLAHGLLPHVSDPLLRTNFRNLESILAVYSADYERALRLNDELVADAAQNGVDFAIDHALTTRAASYIGLRKLAEAHRILKELESRSDTISAFVQGQVALKRAHLRVATGDLRRAEILLRGRPRVRVPVAVIGEWYGSRAVILAGAGAIRQARAAIDRAAGGGAFTDGRNLSRLANAIVALQTQTNHVNLDAVASMMEDGHLDGIVFACRAYPRLATALAAYPGLAQPLTSLLCAARDIDIGRAAGLEMPRELRRLEGLSPREREVHSLLTQGRTNREIAQRLFISESTTKVHVKHIFEKLGVHSRAEAAAARLDERD